MEWHPTQFFSPSPPPFALLILNQPINERAFSVLHQHAKYTICADGGANRYLALMKKYHQELANLPNAIIGDLDSIHPTTRSHYSNLGVKIVHDNDQYSTDFTKCLRFLRDNSAELTSGTVSVSGSGSGSGSKPENPKLDIVILGGLGGRVDQAFSQIHHLYSMSVSPDTRSGDLYLVSEESVTFVLRRGRNVIYTPGTVYKSESRSGQKEGEGREGEGGYLSENAGIIPLTGPTSISTKGFQWDVQDWRTEIGGQLSTSNHIRAQRVEVDCAEAVLFTVELAERLKFGRGGL